MSFSVLSHPLFFFLILFFLIQIDGLKKSLTRLGKISGSKYLRKKPSFFQKLFSGKSIKNPFKAAEKTLDFLRNIFFLLYASIGTLYVSSEGFSQPFFLSGFFFLIFFLIAIDSALAIFNAFYPVFLFHVSFFFTSVVFVFFYPVIRIFLRFQGNVYSIETNHHVQEKPEDLLKDLIFSEDLSFDHSDKKRIASYLTFRKRVAKEIMIPRIHITAIREDATLQEAAELFFEEGYSRIPVYRESLDEITGVLLYKDLFNLYIKHKSIQEPVKSLVKPVIYAPENKKISALLQEFRSQQIHFAMIVDEYGGTEGIVTIEDILEELVGEIEDEYDAPEKDLFWKLPNGSWVVDAQMSIIDIGEKLGIAIPQNAEYETIGGYVFYRAGTIPSKGWSMHHDTFDLEVLQSSERSVEKIRITGIKKEKSSG